MFLTSSRLAQVSYYDSCTPKAAREESTKVQALFKMPLASHLPVSHWTKQVTRPGPASMVERQTLYLDEKKGKVQLPRSMKSEMGRIMEANL